MDSTQSQRGMLQARGRQRRERILDVAAHHFATTGFAGTSIAMVAEGAGVTDAGLLYHFVNKEELMLAVLERHDQREAELLRALIRPGGLDGLRALRDWGIEMERTAELTNLHVLLSAEHAGDDSSANRYFRRRYATVVRTLATLVSEGIQRGEVRRDADPVAEAQQLLALTDGIRLQWFYSDGSTSISLVVRRAVDLLVERLSVDRATDRT